MEHIFLAVLNMSLTSSFVILGVLILRRCLRKAPSAFSYALWILPFFRLVCPLSFESIFCLIPISSKTIPENIAYMPQPAIHSNLSAMDVIINRSLPEATPAASINPIQAWIFIGLILWLSGIVILLFINGFSTLRLYLHLRKAQCLRENIYFSNQIRIPFVFGVFAPKIYLPSSLLQEELSYIILHEQTHIRRRDYLVKLFACLITCMHWFNPFVWCALHFLEKDMELSCDESVIRKMGNDIKQEYSHSLLLLAAGNRAQRSALPRKHFSSPLAFGEKNTKERIQNVLYYKKPAVWVMGTGILVLLCAVIVLLSSRPSEAPLGTTAATPAEPSFAASDSIKNGSTNSFGVPEEVLTQAILLIAQHYEILKNTELDYDYSDWRIEHLQHDYTYEDFKGMELEVYQLNYEFLSDSPESVVLVGGMSMTEDGWVVPGYPNSTYLVFQKEGEQLTFLTHLMENDCDPGDEIFTSDLELRLNPE